MALSFAEQPIAPSVPTIPPIEYARVLSGPETQPHYNERIFRLSIRKSIEGLSVGNTLLESAARRREQLRKNLRDEGLEAVLVSSPSNVTYLTGFTGDSSYLIVGRDHTILVSDGRFTAQIADECPGLDAHIRPPSQPLPDAVAEVVRKLQLHAVGFENAHMSVGEYDSFRELAPAVSWKGAAERVERLRAVKDAFEVGQIREAVRIAERAFAMFRAMLRPDDSEKDLSDALELYLRRAGGRSSSFPSIVAVGDRSALPHAPPTGRTVSEADLMLVDWGASGRLYKSDLTRVLITHKNSAFSRPAQREEFAAKLHEVYPVVLRAQERAIRAVRPGVVATDLDAEARSVITEAGFGDFFTHGLGHGLGLQVHEAPMLKPGSQAVLEAGMVITIEPGVYLPGWGGIRIEDDVLVTADGGEVLTSVPKDLESIQIFES
jgi:Xaa-Pro aminopeptidase